MYSLWSFLENKKNLGAQLRKFLPNSIFYELHISKFSIFRNIHQN